MIWNCGKWQSHSEFHSAEKSESLESFDGGTERGF